MLPSNAFGFDLEHRQIVNAALCTAPTAFEPCSVSSRQRTREVLDLSVEPIQSFERILRHFRIRARAGIQDSNAQEPGPRGSPQLWQGLGVLGAASLPAPTAKADSSFFSRRPPQWGHFGFLPPWLMTSNFRSQAQNWYSNIGIASSFASYRQDSMGAFASVRAPVVFAVHRRDAGPARPESFMPETRKGPFLSGFGEVAVRSRAVDQTR
jgi:hypothetical protein